MSDREARTSDLVLSTRKIPVPNTISPEAQAFLGAMAKAPVSAEPDPTDIAGWRRHLEDRSRVITEMTAQAAAAYPSHVVVRRLTHFELYEVVPSTIFDANGARAILYLHGGAYVMGGGLAAAHMSQPLASQSAIRAFSVDYRMPPEYPFPAALDDAIEAYRFVLSRYLPENIAVCGSSAGGGLAASFVLKARDTGLPLPGACVLGTPELDLTESGDTFETNNTIDVVLKQRLTNSILLYANGHDLTDPYLSAIFGDFSRGFPSTILTSGTRDLFLSNTVRMHRALRRAGVKTELHVFEAMPHGGFFGSAPEDQEVLTEQVRFIEENLGT